MIIKGVFGLPSIRPETNEKYKQPIPTAVVTFVEDGGEEYEMITSSLGRYEIDLPVGFYSIEAYIKGDSQAVSYIRQGMKFIVTKDTKEGAFDEWLMVGAVRDTDPVLKQWLEVLYEMRDIRSNAVGEISNIRDQTDELITRKTKEIDTKYEEVKTHISKTTSDINSIDAKIEGNLESSNLSLEEVKKLEASAKDSKDKALLSEKNSKTSETRAILAETNSKESETNAKSSETSAKTSATTATTKATNATKEADRAKTIADGLVESVDSKLVSKQDKLEFVGSGKVMREGAYGVGIATISKEENYLDSLGYKNGFFAGYLDPGARYEFMGVNLAYGSSMSCVLGIHMSTSRLMYKMRKEGSDTEWFSVYSNANTTTDQNGFLRASGSANALTESDRTSSLGTSTTLVASQKLVNDVSTRTTTAQKRADSAYNLAQTKQDKLTFTGTGNVARMSEVEKKIDKTSITSDFGNSKEKVASQFLVSLSALSDDSVAIYKKDSYSPIFEKLSASAIKIKSGTTLKINGGIVDLSGKVVEMKDKQMGNDYVVSCNKKGDVAITIDMFEDPASLQDGHEIIGGFFYSEIGEGETISSGEFATSGSGMIWTQDDVDRIRGINEFSFWDLRFRAGGAVNSPSSARYGQLSNHGMVFDRSTNRWYAIYHVSTDVDKYGVSRAGTGLASGTVLPIIPSAFGGNGTKKYDALNWWVANELVASHGARLLYEHEFNSRAFGVTENKRAGGADVTYPKTERIKGLTSRIGCEQATGTHWYWGLDSSYRHDVSDWSYKDVTSGRGQVYTYGTYGLVRAIFGGRRSYDAANVGSRQSDWGYYPWRSDWSIGAVASRDLLIL